MVFAGPKSEYLFAGLQVGGLYLNTDRQGPDPTWQRVSEALPIGPARNVAGMVVSGPDRTTIVIAAGTGIFRRLDSDEPWKRLGGEVGLPEDDVQAKALTQGRQNSEVLYVALADEGIYRSDDSGATWQPVRGDLDVELIRFVSTLTVGAKDDTVYLGLETGQVYRTDNAGTTWQLLSQVVDLGLRELNWSQRTAWDVFLHGGQRRMLYARADDGIYVSYDEGKTWQLRLRGFFNTILADPHRPWTVYVASPSTTLDKEFEAPVSLTPDLWISDDGGETWKWAGPGPLLPADSSLHTNSSTPSFTTLAFDPNDASLIYVGTEAAGVFWANLPSVARPYTPRAVALFVALIVILALLLGGFGLVTDTGRRLGRPYGLPPHTWPRLTYLRLRYDNEVGLVSDRHTPLTSLQRLALALTLDQLSSPGGIWQDLKDAGIPADLIQVEKALSELRDYSLLHRSEGQYKSAWSLLRRVARARFWDDSKERQRLIAEVQGESHFRADARRLFKLAGFETASLEAGFKVTSNRPEYALLGASQGIYVHLHTAVVVDAEQIKKVRDNVSRVYENQLAGRIAFLIVNGYPQVETYQHIVHLQQEEDFRLVLLSYHLVRRATEAMSSRRTLGYGLRRALGNQDLFQLDEPIVDLLDFFGHETAVQTLVQACRAGRVIGLNGPDGVGKTSLARQVVDRLPGAIVAWIDPSDRSASLYADVRRAWLLEASNRFPDWDPPDLQFPIEQLTQAQIRDDLTAICQSLPEQMHLAVVLDGLVDLTGDVQRLAQIAIALEAVSLLGVFDAWPRHAPPFEEFLVQPFDLGASTRLIESLAVQMKLDFDRAAKERLHQASEGHPLILRRLASLAVALRESSSGLIDAADVDRAVSRYGSQSDSLLSRR